MFDDLDMDNLSDDERAWLKSWNRPVPEGKRPAQEPTQEPSGGPNPAESTPEATGGQGDQQDANGGAQGENTGTEEGDDYNEWSNDELQAELVERGLPKSGNKAELISRLEADDARLEADGDPE